MPMQESNLSIFVCPYCFDYKMLYQKPMSVNATNSMHEHMISCSPRRKSMIQNAINKTIDENYNLLLQLSDSDDE
jgi:hypothetical protein